jgi:hypothetical protein
MDSVVVLSLFDQVTERVLAENTQWGWWHW